MGNVNNPIRKDGKRVVCSVCGQGVKNFRSTITGCTTACQHNNPEGERCDGSYRNAITQEAK